MRSCRRPARCLCTCSCSPHAWAAVMQVLIVHGENDRLLPLRNSRRLASLIPHCQLVTLPKCGHSPQEEAPDLLVERIQHFLGAACA